MQRCVNTVGRYRCEAQCGTGFKPSSKGDSCEDVDECVESSVSPCQHQCVNTLGSFRCVCRSGFKPHGHRCIDINECLQSVCAGNQDCRNTDGGYQCFEICPSGTIQSESGVCSDSKSVCASVSKRPGKFPLRVSSRFGAAWRRMFLCQFGQRENLDKQNTALDQTASTTPFHSELAVLDQDTV
ncbi:complement component C1q receptor-like [Hoplias malabaricus]|uniref:complement component C1q receptor-like n=1 Tax=Hoplias malabaricus TaxID=27720 RepID=UPI0034620D98